MTKPSKVDLVGVGLNATDTVIPSPNIPPAAPRRILHLHHSSRRTGRHHRRRLPALGHTHPLVGNSATTPPPPSIAKPSPTPVSTPTSSPSPAAQPQSLILVDADGERTVLCRRDERLTLRPTDLNREWIVNARALHVDGYDTAAAILAAAWAREAGIPVIADLDELYPGVELSSTTSTTSSSAATSPPASPASPTSSKPSGMMHRRYGCRLAAATLGHDGVLAWDGNTSATPPPTVSPSSTPPAPETSSTPASSTASYRTGPSIASSTSPVPPPPSTAPPSAHAAASIPRSIATLIATGTRYPTAVYERARSV